MNIKLLTGLALATTVLTSAAQAEERWPRWYLGLTGAGQFMNDQDVKTGGASVSSEYDTGYGFGAALGYRPSFGGGFFDHTRYEVEFFYRQNDLDSVGGVNADGDVTAMTYMVNAYYDFRNTSRWTPYVGLGLGAAHLKYDTGIGRDDTDTVFAYQFMAGITYAPETIPMTEWGLGYRYLGTNDAEFTFTPGANTEVEYDNHGVELNAKLRF